MAARVVSRSFSWPRAKPSSITTFSPWPMTRTIAAESTIATRATAMRARYGTRSRKSGRSLLRALAAPLDHRTRDGTAHVERAAVLRHLRADLEVGVTCERAVGGDIDIAVAVQNAALEAHRAIRCAMLGARVLA